MSVTQIEEPNFSKHIVYKKRYCCSRNLSNSNLCKYFRQTFFIFLIINESTEILALPKTKSISSTIPWTSTATEVVHQIFNVRDTAVGIRSRNIEYFTESDGSRSKSKYFLNIWNIVVISCALNEYHNCVLVCIIGRNLINQMHE